MKLIFAIRSGAQASQPTRTSSPISIAPSCGSGTKKRTFTFAGGSIETTGAPAAPHFGLGGLDLVRPRAELRRLQLGLELRDARLVALVLGVRLLDVLAAHRVP